MRLSRLHTLAALLFAFVLAAPQHEIAAQAISGTSPQNAPQNARIRSYIANGWETLSRSMSDCSSVVDAKVKTVPVMYLPADMPIPAAVAAMQQKCHVEVRHLPRAIHGIGEVRPAELPVEGLLYLPNRYVVPGGRFNEMYGWDSYFILLGLLHDGHSDLARGMVENFFFEIENYGAILNANRTYFFTRSQPPFLSSMIREVYEHPASGTAPDLKWLARAYGFAQRDYALWTSPQHKAGTTGLARYHDLGEGPVPEMSDDSSYYPDVIRWLLAHPKDHPEYLVDGAEDPTPAQAATLARTSCDVHISHVCAQAVVAGHRLSADFYRGDRAMRESGFDSSFRFGPFSGSTAHFAPVCLNSLLFRYEQDMAHFATLLGRPREAAEWTRRANARHHAIDRYLWDSDAGLYFDYDYTTGQRSSYHYISTFYPLWAGAASPTQAAAVHQHLSLFEHPGGLAMSDSASGVQWDLPFGWAPTTWLAVSGLEHNGFHEDARRIAQSFSATVLDNFLHDGTIREKYNVVSGSANVKVAAGYKSNVIGFGWTNGVYLELQDLLAAPAH
ncbi:trehalase family glycosidase [Granulicella mallensis]|uniref:Alpha,alpha-trehalase n=1 Tax=Granulicella mallensis TaxID=940614 RepID=A0A7W7ZTR2_9BACT|nr:trehalase family glycosidase [Granulicella mallensis]MBB5065948.1 alpha,alpha-trehalase [Granulicella mallensis]